MTEPDMSGAKSPGFEEEAVPFVDDPPELAAAVQRGLADMRAGRVVAHSEVKAWLLKWGDGDPGPPPKARNSVD